MTGTELTGSGCSPMAIRRLLSLTLLLLAACRSSEPEAENGGLANAQTEQTVNVPAPTNALEQPAPSPAVDPIDPTSAGAAVQLVVRYGEWLEQRRFAEARRLWGDNAPGEAEFAAGFDNYATIDARVGAPSNMEGAAGSIYVDVTLTLSGMLKSGGRYGVSGPITLRRANDVPGSTAGQRRWHIHAAGLKPVS